MRRFFFEKILIAREEVEVSYSMNPNPLGDVFRYAWISRYSFGSEGCDHHRVPTEMLQVFHKTKNPLNRNASVGWEVIGENDDFSAQFKRGLSETTNFLRFR